MKHEEKSIAIDLDVVQPNPKSIVDRYVENYVKWRETTLLAMCKAMIEENPDATEFFFYDQADHANSSFSINLIVPDSNGIHMVPDGVATVTRVDLVGYKEMVRLGKIKP
jgi:hypothetical protein